MTPVTPVEPVGPVGPVAPVVPIPAPACSLTITSITFSSATVLNSAGGSTVTAIIFSSTIVSNWDRAAQSMGLPHANYGINQWPDKWPSGDCYRWDLAKLRESDKLGVGGHELRMRISEWMRKL